MTGFAWVAAGLVVATGLQLLARLVQHVSADHRPPGRLIELSRRQRPTIQPLDLDVLESMVSDGLLSDSHLDRNLLPFLDRLAAGSPGPAVTIGRPGRRQRSRWLADAIDQLEASWGVADEAAASTRRRR